MNSTATTNATPPLWRQPIEVIGLTGDFASGKTLFSLSISPGPSTLVYDTEKSSGTYESLGFRRIDITQEMLTSHPNGHKAIDVFRWWYTDVRKIKPGQYRVIVLDTVSEIENGLVDYVRTNPNQFGLTATQVTSSAGLLWGAVKDFWKSILSDIAARCETFAFTSHLKSEFKGGRPTGRKVQKGKETLMELASLYLWMEREPDKKGNVPDIPSATVLKSRLATTTIGDDGNVRVIPTLPPRIPQATPAAIRAYMDAPPDYTRLKAAERVQVHEATPEELAAMQLAAAEAQRDAEAMALQRVSMTQRAYAQTPIQVSDTVHAAAETEAQAQKPRANAPSAVDPTPPAQAATDDQVGQIQFLVDKLANAPHPMPTPKQEDVLKRIPNLSKENADQLITKLISLAKQQFPDLQLLNPERNDPKNSVGPDF